MSKRSKKHPKDMTTEELAKAVFPKKVIEELKKIVHGEEKPEKGQSE